MGNVFNKHKKKKKMSKKAKEKKQDIMAQMREHMSEEEVKDFNTKIIYLRGEFQTMEKEKINLGEFIRLLMMLRYRKGEKAIKLVWQSLKKSDRSTMIEDEYVNLMLENEELEEETSCWRSMYGDRFDTDKSGWASKEDVIMGLEEMLEIKLPQNILEKIEAMDENGDKKIYYNNFLKMQLKLM